MPLVLLSYRHVPTSPRLQQSSLMFACQLLFYKLYCRHCLLLATLAASGQLLGEFFQVSCRENAPRVLDSRFAQTMTTEIYGCSARFSMCIFMNWDPVPEDARPPAPAAPH